MEQNYIKLETIREKLYSNTTVEFNALPIIQPFNSDFQKIALYQHETMGKVLLLDDIVQYATQDEYILHETLAYWPYCSKQESPNVLIVGGGDLGVASRFLAIPEIQSVTIVDIDPEVTQISCRYTPEVSQHAEEDSRLRIVHEDARTFIETFQENSFDIIVADTTDEVGVGESLYSVEFLQEMHRILKDKGVLMRLAGSFFLQESHVADVLKKTKEVFGRESCGLIGLPLNMYQGGLYTIVAAVKNDFYDPSPKKNLVIKTRWYSPSVHAAVSSIVPILGHSGSSKNLI